MSKKSIFASKTLWVQGIAAFAAVVQSYTGFIVEPRVQLALLIIVNVVVRLVTKEPIVWGD